MKRLQFKVEKVYCIHVKDNLNYNSQEEVASAIAEYLLRNNMEAQIEFFDNIIVICKDCGVTLKTDEEIKDGCCAQCGAVIK